MSKDISDLYTQYKWDSRFAPATLTNYTQYGGHHGVPWTQRGEVVYYNKEHFAKAGITNPPTTYDELVADAAKLKDAGITPITFGGKDNWHVMRLLDSILETKCGAEKGDQLNTRKASWATEPCVAQSFTELKTWSDNYFNKGFIGLAQTEAANIFHTSKAAMALEGDWFTQQIIDNGLSIDKVGTFMFPTGTNRLYGFGEGQYVGAKSANAAQAGKFLDYVTSEAVQSEIGPQFAAQSVNVNAKSATTPNAVETAFAGYFTSAKGFYLNNDQNFPLKVTTEYWRIQNAVATGSVKPDEAGAQLQKFIDAQK